MHDKSRSIRLQSLWLLITTNTVLAIIAGIAWYVLSRMTDLSDLSLLVVVVVIITAIGLLLAIIQERIISQPLLLLLRALDHVRSQGSQNGAPPNPSKLSYGRQVVEQIAGDIYEMASQSTLSRNEGKMNEHMTAILDKMNAGVVVLDKAGTITYANMHAKQIFKPTEGELENSPFPLASNLHFQTGILFTQWLEDCRTNKPTHEDFWNRVRNTQPDGTIKLFDMAAFYSKADSDGIEVILVTVDRTDEYSVDEAEMDFVALAAHELRGPITVVRGYLDVLSSEQTEATPPEHRKLLERMRVSANQLSNYIHTILNVAKVEQGTMKIHPHEQQWLPLVRQTTHDLTIRAKAMNRKIEYNFPETVATVAVDEGSIGQVLANILDNAIKYSDEGGTITVSVEQKDDMIETTITDHGAGIPEAVVGNLFNKFYRSHRSKQGVSGTGLGLYLSKAIVEAHGGNIWVQSKEGTGSTFGFSVPVYSEELAKQIDESGAKAMIERKGHGWIKNHSKVIK